MSRSWPEVSVQGVLDGEWWQKEPSGALRPGLLVWAFLPHVDLLPYRLRVEGRTQARVHERFEGVIEPLSVRAPRAVRTLPVAGLPEFPGESYTVHRSKKRPALVLSAAGQEVPRTLRRGAPNWQTAPTVLVAPYYGGDQDGSRGGWKPAFVERIQQVEYPQFFWDCLPIGGPSGSILRLDHVQPVGAHQNAFEPTGFSLSPAALVLIRDQLDWLMAGDGAPPAEGELAELRSFLAELAAS